MMYYVREISNPLNIIAWGHSESGQYSFDNTLYEEVFGSLPSGYQLVKLKTKSELITEKKLEIRDSYKSAPLNIREQFVLALAQVLSSLDIEDYTLAESVMMAVDISETTIPDPADRAIATDIKNTILAKIQEIISL